MAKPNPAHTTRFPPVDLNAAHNLVSCVLDDDVVRTDPGTAHLLFTCAFTSALGDHEEAAKCVSVLGATQVLDEGHITAEDFMRHLRTRVQERLRAARRAK